MKGRKEWLSHFRIFRQVSNSLLPSEDPRTREFWTKRLLFYQQNFIDTIEFRQRTFRKLLKLGFVLVTETWLCTLICRHIWSVPTANVFAGGDTRQRDFIERSLRLGVIPHSPIDQSWKGHHHLMSWCWVPEHSRPVGKAVWYQDAYSVHFESEASSSHFFSSPLLRS